MSRKTNALACAFSNEKGGTGKTTVAVNLAAGIARQGKCVLVIDCDPQGNASHHLGYEEGTTLTDVLKGRKSSDLAVTRYADRINYMPANHDLAELQGKIEQEDFRELIAPYRSIYDYIFFDTPPGVSDLLIAPLSVSDQIFLCVLGESGLGILGLNLIEQTINRIRALNPLLEVGGVIIDQASGRKTKINRDLMKLLEDRYNGLLYESKIRKTVRLAEAAIMGRDIFSHVSKSQIAYQDFEVLTREFLRRHNGNFRENHAEQNGDSPPVPRQDQGR